MAVCKVLGLLCMFMGCALFGIGRAMEYREREENNRYLVYILDCLMGQIVYQQSTIEDCIYELSGKVKEPFQSCFKDMYLQIRENPEVAPLSIMEESLGELFGKLQIKRDVAGLFTECFKHSGFQDTGVVENVLKGIKNRLLEYNAGALEESRKQSRLALYLGMFGGMFCVILCL